MKNAIGYIRVSTEGQSGEDRFGVVAQKEAILTYAEQHGYRIIEWKEDHISGVKDDRPAFNEILYGEAHDFQTVIVFKNDRVARDVKLYFYYQFCLEKKGIELLSTQEDYGEYGDFAPIIAAMMSFVAGQERKNILLRTELGKAQKAKTGGYCGGRVPFGYKVQNRQLVINEDEAPTVRLIFELLDSGSNMSEVARTLNTAGYKTRNDTGFDTAKIRSIKLNRRTYEGMIKTRDGEWIQGLQEPILVDPMD